MTRIRFNDIEVLYRPRQRNINRIDKKLVHFERLVALVFGPAVLKSINGKIIIGNAVHNFIKHASMS